MFDTRPEQPAPSLDHLTGVRSSKPRFYAEYRDAAASLRRSLRALSAISAALSAVTSTPEVLARAVLDAVGDLLHPDWALLVLDGSVLSTEANLVAVRRPDGSVLHGPDGLPEPVRTLLFGVPGGSDLGAEPGGPRSIAVPMVLEDRRVGTLTAWRPRETGLGESDDSILRILANQAVVAFRTGALFRQSEDLRQRMTDLYEEADGRAHDLAVRNDELRAARALLLGAQTQAILDGERQRIARELHDSVAQHVLSAGMNVEWCRSRPVEPGVAERLGLAKQLLRDAVERIRATIFTLTGESGHPARDLPALLRELGRAPSDVLAARVEVSIRGSYPGLPQSVEHSLYRIASEALFNATVHARASRVCVRLISGPQLVQLAVEDDGVGDPGALRRSLAVSSRTDLGGLHRGLAHMAERARDVQATLRVTRARVGGVRISVSVPVTNAAEEGTL